MKEVERQGELSHSNRKEIWKTFKLEPESAKEKRVQLELDCLQKVMDSWKEDEPISAGLQDTFKEIVEAIRSNDQRELKELLPCFYDECEYLLEEDTTNFYEDYLQQSIRYLMAVIKDVPIYGEVAESTVLKNRDMEYDERDTSYCACMMWAYQNIASSDTEIKRREMEFWDWYIKEAAKQQGIIIETTVKIPKSMMDIPKVEIDTIEDFVKYISYESDYIKYEKKENKLLIVYVIEAKDGSYCTKCGKFSNHIKSSILGSESIGKLKWWTVEFGLTDPIYYCDNPECSEEIFFPVSKVWHIERVVHFSYLKSLPEIQEKICALFNIK